MILSCRVFFFLHKIFIEELCINMEYKYGIETLLVFGEEVIL